MTPNKFCDFKQKGKKHFNPAGSCAWAGLWPAVTRTLSTSQSFQTFLKHNVGNPVLLLSPPLTLIDSNPWPVGYKPSALTPNSPLLSCPWQDINILAHKIRSLVLEMVVSVASLLLLGSLSPTLPMSPEVSMKLQLLL